MRAHPPPPLPGRPAAALIPGSTTTLADLLAEMPGEQRTRVLDAMDEAYRKHHMWVRPGNHYLVQDFVADAKAGHNICASVYVECGSFYRKSGPIEMQTIGEVEFANGMAAMAARRAR